MSKTLKKVTYEAQATVICKNCGSSVSGNFCSNCGQSANTHKLNIHFILHDLQHGLFHFDKGILYTAKELLTRPGHTIREFIEGKRVRHFQPLSFVIVLATFYGLLYHYLIVVQSKAPFEPKNDITGVSGRIVTWITEHFAFDCLILIITTTLVSYVIFKKKQYNFVEHLTLNTFTMGLLLVISLLPFPIIAILGDSATLLYGIIQQALLLVLMCWCYAQFFNTTSKIKIISLAILAFLITSILNLAIGYSARWVIMQF